MVIDMKIKDTIKIIICVDKDAKEIAGDLFKQLGIDMNTAFNIFLYAVVNEQGLPFPVSLKRSDSVTNCLPNNIKGGGSLIARYDEETKQAYLENK
jgi:addiction module RelB/DinJ family antitoxin